MPALDEEELKELEDEAFGPPARPGDPDFPGSTSEEEAVASEAAVRERFRRRDGRGGDFWKPRLG